jgi:hypothetical protein
MATIPTSGFCSTGTASPVSGTGPWTWSCNGSNGGTTASCSANKTTTPPPVPLPTAYAYYRLDDNAASTAVLDDQLANSITANVNTSALSSTGKVDKGFTFNGTNQYVDMQRLFSNIRTDSSGSISLWVKPVNSYPIIEFSGPGGYFSVEWYQKNQSATFAISGGGTPISLTTATGSLPANTFSHLVITQDGTQLKIFINGVEQSGLTYWAKSNPGAWLSFLTGSIINTRLGATVEGSNQYFFNGSVDDLRYFKRALTSAEVTAIYDSAGPTIVPPSFDTISVQPSLIPGAIVLKPILSKKNGSAVAVIEDIPEGIAASAWMKSGTGKKPLHIVFEPGTYSINKSWIWTEESSGTADAPIVVEARIPGSVIISGGLELTSPPVTKAGVLVSANLTSTPISSAEQLWVNDVRATRARTLTRAHSFMWDKKLMFITAQR